MNPNLVEIQGTLEADGRLILDEKPTLPPGRVRVALEAIRGDVENGADVLTVLNRIRANQMTRGHVARTREQIDAAIETMRGEDEERMQAKEHLQNECRQTRRQRSSAKNP